MSHLARMQTLPFTLPFDHWEVHSSNDNDTFDHWEVHSSNDHDTLMEGCFAMNGLVFSFILDAYNNNNNNNNNNSNNNNNKYNNKY